MEKKKRSNGKEQLFFLSFFLSFKDIEVAPGDANFQSSPAVPADLEDRTAQLPFRDLGEALDAPRELAVQVVGLGACLNLE